MTICKIHAFGSKSPASDKRTTRLISLCASAAVLATSCTSHPTHVASEAKISSPPTLIKEWQAIATPEDAARLAVLTATWTADRAGLPATLMKRLQTAGPLLDPLAALYLPALPPGPYQCRLFRIGGKQGYTVFRPNICYVEADASGVSFTKQNGEFLPGGWLFPDTDHRMVFLGTTRDRGQLRAPAYGQVASLDVIGIVERVAPFRWRIVLAAAGREHRSDIYELVPIVSPN